MSDLPTIETLAPEGKKGVVILLRRYEQMKQYLLQTLENTSPMAYQDVNVRAIDDLEGIFDGKVGWYLKAITLDLEMRGIIEQVPFSDPVEIGLVVRG